MIWRVLAVAAALCLDLRAQSNAIFIETIAGAARFDNRPARQTPLVQPEAVWVDPRNGDLFISDGNFVVRRVRNGISTIVAGGGAVIDNSLPIPGTAANLDYPNGLAGAPSGDLYISDVNHNRIQRLNSNGTIVTVVGKGTPGFSGDGGRGTFAELEGPTSLALSLTGDLFIADRDNAVIRKYNIQTGIITTYAGTPGEFGYSGNGRLAVLAKLGSVQSLAIDSLGTLYLAETLYDSAGEEAEARIRRITPDGIIDIYAGAGPAGDSGDNGSAKLAKISSSSGLAVDAAQNLYIADSTNSRIRVVNRAGIISAYAGRSKPINPGAENVPATDVYLNTPGAIALDAAGNLFIPESTGVLVRRVDARTRIITTVAGTSNPYDNTLAADAPVNRPTSVATDKFGNIYIADGHYRIRKIDAKTKSISTVAGDGKWAQAVDATANSLGNTLAISVDPLNRLLIADRYEGLIRVVDLNTGVMRTLLDLTKYDSEPTGVAGDELGYVYISDWWADQVYEYAPNGDLSIVAGVEYDENATSLYTGDGGLGWKANVNGPQGLAIDSTGRLLICDTGNHVVRVLDLDTYIINTFAGDGLDNSDYDTYPAVQASLRSPVAVAVGLGGWVYIADSAANQIRIVTEEGIIYTAGGGNGRGFAGDGGLAILSLFNKPLGVAVTDTDIYVADSFNYRVRRLFWLSVQNNLVVDPPKLTFRATSGGSTPSIQLLTVNTTYLGLPVDYTVDDSDGSWLYACTATDTTDSCYLGTTPDLIGVEARPRGLGPGKYTATLVISAAGAPDVKIPVEFIVDPPNVVTSVTLSPPVLRFTAPQNSSSVQRLDVSSAGQPLAWSIRRQTESAWLKFSATSGTTPSSVEATVDSSALRPGTYYSISYVDVTGGSPTLLIATITVTDAKPALQLDRDSMLFEAIEGTTAAQPQPVRIYNTGGAPLSWQLAIPPEDDQRRAVNWLRPSISKDTVQSGAAPSLVNISVDPAGLRAGVYSVPVVITAASAAGAPQVLSVRMRILPATAKARPVFDRTGLVFVGSPGGKINEQTVQLSSTGGPLSFSTSIRTENRIPWLAVSPSSGSVLSSAQVTSLRFQVTNTSLDPGIYRGNVNVSFVDGSVREVTVTMILRAGAGAGVSSLKDRSAGCEPKEQVMVVPTLSDNFALNVGWPIPIQAQVFDDCGSPSAISSVNVVFDNGDPVLALKNLSGGQYSGTWTPAGAASGSVSITMSALRPGMKNGTWISRGRITREASAPPILSSGGVLNAASRIGTSLLAPGERLVLQGANLPDSAVDATVLVGDAVAKVISSSPSEMQIVAPSRLDGVSQTYIIVKARDFSTSPQTVSVAPADPGLYPLPEGTAASPGAALTVTATGLGAVNATGNVTLPVTAKLGDLDATVTSATLPATADGIYQLRITVPAGAYGAQELTIFQNGVSSNPIPVNVR